MKKSCRPMIIVVDGPDHSGKTTLAKELIKQNGQGHHLHLTYRWPEKMDLYHFAAIRYALKKGGLVVIDRWWLSEIVYANVYRGGTKWPDLPKYLDKHLTDAGGFQVICLPDKNWCLAGHQSRHAQGLEMYSNIEKVYDEYARTWTNLMCMGHFYRYNPCRISPQQAAKIFLEVAK